MRKLAILLLFTASAAFAQTPHELYPSDYKPRPCTEGISCATFVDVDFASAAFKFLLRELRPDWLVKHDAEMREFVKPYCAKRATCMTYPGNEWWFCNDVFASELRQACDSKFTPKSDDNTQCHTWVDTYSAGVDQRGSTDWKKAQACAKNLPPVTGGKLEWWSSPAVIPMDYKGDIRIYTIDAATHIPVMTNFTIGDQIIYSTDTPTGRLVSYYTFKWPRKLVRIPNAQGLTDVIAPNITMTAAGHDSVVVPMPTAVQKVNVSMSPSAEKLHAGTNKVTVTVTDAATGKPAEGQVYLGDVTVGFANQPFDLTLPSGKRPDLWVKSPYDAYSDAVLAPAK